MKCYVGGSTEPSEFNFVTACFAENAKEAKKMMWEKGELSEDCDYEYIFARVVRAPEHDHLFEKDGCTDAHIIRNEWTLREMGWMIYGDQRCSICEMAVGQGFEPREDY